jgi:hypothetical protein
MVVILRVHVQVVPRTTCTVPVAFSKDSVRSISTLPVDSTLLLVVEYNCTRFRVLSTSNVILRISSREFSASARVSLLLAVPVVPCSTRESSVPALMATKFCGDRYVLSVQLYEYFAALYSPGYKYNVLCM